MRTYFKHRSHTNSLSHSTWGGGGAPDPDGPSAVDAPRVDPLSPPFAPPRESRGYGEKYQASTSCFPHSITLTFFTLVRSSCSFSSFWSIGARSSTAPATLLISLYRRFKLRVSLRPDARGVSASPARGEERSALSSVSASSTADVYGSSAEPGSHSSRRLSKPAYRT